MKYRTRRGSCVTDNSGFGGGIADAKSVLPESARVHILMRKEIKMEEPHENKSEQRRFYHKTGEADVSEDSKQSKTSSETDKIVRSRPYFEKE